MAESMRPYSWTHSCQLYLRTVGASATPPVVLRTAGNLWISTNLFRSPSDSTTCQQDRYTARRSMTDTIDLEEHCR